jgi:hypothetical protein
MEGRMDGGMQRDASSLPFHTMLLMLSFYMGI